MTCIYACRQTNPDIENLIKKKETKYFKKYTLFNDSNYIFTLTVIDTTDSYRVEKPTAVTNLYHIRENKIDTLINDSIFARNRMSETSELEIEYADYNFDKTKDILIPAGTDPRGNHGYHLYVVDNKRKTLTYIKGFEDIGNPETNEKYKIIESFVLTGQNFWQFFRIDKNNKLVDLGHQISENGNERDSINYINALIEIEKEKN